MKSAVVWSKEMCPHCEQAKSLLKTRGINFEERKIGQGFSREDLLEHVPTARSVPQIFINDKYIGGYTELKKFLSENAQ